MSRLVTAEAVELLPAAAYRTDTWYEARRRAVSASEIAGLMGLANDRWTSPFDLWWAKRTGTDSQPESDDMRRGRRYEPLILEEFADTHPELHLARVGLCQNLQRPWQVCTPDALAYEEAGQGPPQPDIWLEPVAVVEAKSDARRDEWGDEGSDVIPVAYRAQVQWQMDCLGLSVAYLPVLFGFDFRTYVVTYDEADVAVMREAAQTFLADVEADRQPDIDSARATTRRLKLLHPTLVDDTCEVPPAVVAQWRVAKRLRDAAEARMRLAENRLRHRLGPVKTATVDGVKVATRSVYDVAERTQTIRGHTVDRINITPPRKPKEASK